MKRTIGEQVNKPADCRTFRPSSDLVDNSTYVGLEIEVENMKRAPDKYSQFLSVKADGSLRNGGLEVIFSHPLRGEDVVKATTEIFKGLEAAGKPEFSERCGVHVHLDVRPLSPEQLLSIVSNYSIFERSLYKFCGGNRSSNIFCLPYYKAERGLHNLGDFHKSGNVMFLLEYADKYYGLNIKAVDRYGSLEYRMLPGTPSSARVLTWINILLSIHKWSVANTRNGHDLLKSVSKMGVLDYAKQVFADVPDFLQYVSSEDMYEGMRFVQGLTTPELYKIQDKMPDKYTERSTILKYFAQRGVDLTKGQEKNEGVISKEDIMRAQAAGAQAGQWAAGDEQRIRADRVAQVERHHVAPVPVDLFGNND